MTTCGSSTACTKATFRRLTCRGGPDPASWLTSCWSNGRFLFIFRTGNKGIMLKNLSVYHLSAGTLISVFLWTYDDVLCPSYLFQCTSSRWKSWTGFSGKIPQYSLDRVYLLLSLHGPSRNSYMSILAVGRISQHQIFHGTGTVPYGFYLRSVGCGLNRVFNFFRRGSRTVEYVGILSTFMVNFPHSKNLIIYHYYGYLKGLFILRWAIY